MSASAAAAAASSSSPAKPLTAESTIRRVVVYSDRAQVFRIGSVNAAAGDHTILFEGMWNSVNRDTLQVATTPIAGASVILRSVQFTTIHDVVDVRPLRREVDEKLAALEIPLEDAQDEIDLASRAIANYDALKAKLTKSLSDGSHPKGSPFVYDVALWGKFAGFVEEGRGAELRKKRAAERKLADLRKKKEDLEAERRRLGSGDEKRTSREVAEVTLTVVKSAAPTEAVKIEMMLSYMVNGCSWTPSYDLRIDKVKKTMDITYSGVVQQHAGEAWNDVRLELSTAKAHVGGEIPNFPSTWYLRKKEYHHVQYEAEAREALFSARNMMMQQMMTNVMPTASPAAASSSSSSSRRNFAVAQAASAQVNSSSTSATFVIAAVTTVQPDNEPVKVTISMFQLPVFFRYSVVPKIDPNVYLKVKAVNTTDYPLLAGNCNIFADEQLVSRSRMDDVAPSEEFWTFLGQDQSITCTRKELSKKTNEISGGMFGKNKTRTEYSYKFTAKNVKSSEEELVVWDQMPISEDEKITVTLVSPKPDRVDLEPKSKADPPLFKINEVKFIEWFLHLLPQEERTFEFAFNVEWPQENRIVY